VGRAGRARPIPARGAAVLLAASLVAGSCAARPQLPAGTFTEPQVRELLDKTGEIRLDPDLTTLSEPERRALDRLVAAGPIFQRLYERALHHQALDAQADLAALDRRFGSPARTRDLLTLYRLFQGPIATTLDNRRVPFLAVERERPGKNLYPLDADSVALAAFVAGHPEALAPRAVVRSRDGGGFTVVPYATEFTDDVNAARAALTEAADLVEPADPAFASFLRLRSRDLATGDYTAGDSAWVTGGFRILNAQVGSYETYDDALYGVKTFFALSLLVRDRERSDAVSAVASRMQEIEDALPYSSDRRVRGDIPVGVYDVVADFGQARGTNTATILPNEAHITRRFGRRILLRGNIMRDSLLFAEARARFAAAVEPSHAADLGPDGNFNRTLWHEIGHYLGPEHTTSGRAIEEALTDAASLLEELKADLVALHAARPLRAAGFYDDASLRSVHASGILRVLQRVRPRRDEPYGTMQLMQFNWFLEHGLLSFDPASGRIAIHYDRCHDAVRSLLAEVLAIQQRGDKAAADALIARWTTWRPDVHEVLAARMREAEIHRFRLVRYAALGE
jgi:hypothetical protein